ncbi:hypothetical protein KUTeg_009424 [Tegillarca granosa]|uniref:Pescadillo homolog n=1 Tax=Tegillarca granosa TaxID=220873 RepID=A0ABQ9F3U0_TEGGR|nr:hypothetical protein KUTeg_009424 [Tegillarca granosa]
MAHEPVIRKFREFKHFVRRLRKAINKGNSDAAGRIRANKPKYKLDHIVKERYPSFIDALRDLDDPLSMLFLFATFPKTTKTHMEFIQLARRLSVEFLHYVIASHSLRKVFISIKGIYYQAEIMDQTINWVVPHKLGYEHPSDVDYRIMQTFVEFYTTLVGFINYKLYHSLNLHYPPKLEIEGSSIPIQDEKSTDRELMEERLAALTQSLKTIDEGGGEDEPEIDDFPVLNADDPDRVEQAKVEAEKLKKFQNLFKGLKFFLNREVPREALVFIIRSFGGEVSWDYTVAVGSTFQETDESITHQIVDRPKLPRQYLSRYYIQPQWVFDCVNAKMLLPMEDYFPGAVLPPHLSPFVEEQEGEYVPPEKQALLNKQQGIHVDSGVEDDASSEEEEDEGEDDDGDEEEEEELDDDDSDEDQDVDDDETGDEREEEFKKGKKRKMEEKNKDAKKSKKQHMNLSVEAGSVEEDNVERKLQRQKAEERRLGEMMIPKKKKRLYEKIMFSKKKTAQEARILKEKRESIDKIQKKEKKKQKK